MEKYTHKELTELAKGVFADDKHAAAYYADEHGNFKNELQYDALPAEQKEAFIRIDNPATETSEEVVTEGVTIDGKRYTGEEIKTMCQSLVDEFQEKEKAFSETIAEKDATIDKLKGEVDSLDATIVALRGGGAPIKVAEEKVVEPVKPTKGGKK